MTPTPEARCVIFAGWGGWTPTNRICLCAAMPTDDLTMFDLRAATSALCPFSSIRDPSQSLNRSSTRRSKKALGDPSNMKTSATSEDENTSSLYSLPLSPPPHSYFLTHRAGSGLILQYVSFFCSYTLSYPRSYFLFNTHTSSAGRWQPPW